LGFSLRFPEEVKEPKYGKKFIRTDYNNWTDNEILYLISKLSKLLGDRRGH
jgi:hypothetical protein